MTAKKRDQLSVIEYGLPLPFYYYYFIVIIMAQIRVIPGNLGRVATLPSALQNHLKSSEFPRFVEVKSVQFNKLLSKL